MRIAFSDGMEFDTSGPLRITSRSDGLYVVGQGWLCPIDTVDSGVALIRKLTRNRESEERSDV